MFKKSLFIIALAIFSLHSYSQFNTEKKWQLGIGGGLVKFSDEDASFIGDKHLSQIPRFNVTRRLNDDFSADLAVSFGAFDSGVSLITTNSVPYVSIDVSARYKYVKNTQKLDPFVFLGASIVDSSRDMSPTVNLGTGVTYWFSQNFGASSNIYYKHSLDELNMRSHFQFTLGVVFGVNFGGNRNGLGGTGCYYNQHK